METALQVVEPTSAALSCSSAGATGLPGLLGRPLLPLDIFTLGILREGMLAFNALAWSTELSEELRYLPALGASLIGHFNSFRKQNMVRDGTERSEVPLYLLVYIPA